MLFFSFLCAFLQMFSQERANISLINRKRMTELHFKDNKKAKLLQAYSSELLDILHVHVFTCRYLKFIAGYVSCF